MTGISAKGVMTLYSLSSLLGLILKVSTNTSIPIPQALLTLTSNAFIHFISSIASPHLAKEFGIGTVTWIKSSSSFVTPDLPSLPTIPFAPSSTGVPPGLRATTVKTTLTPREPPSSPGSTGEMPGLTWRWTDGSGTSTSGCKMVFEETTPRGLARSKIGIASTACLTVLQRLSSSLKGS